MDLKGFLALPLIFLAAAAAPQTDCSQGASSWDPAQSVPPGFAQPPSSDDGTMTTESNAIPTIRQALDGCGPATIPSSDPSSLRQQNDDVLHGLESSGALAPVDQPRQAPLFR
jgi:hypothetical protein